MSGQEVPRVHTPIAALDLIAAVTAEWSAIFGEEPDPEVVIFLVAQSAFEDGWWKNAWNYDLENSKYTDGADCDFYYVTCDEYINGKLVTLHPPDPGCRFRAFAALRDGVRDWLRLMKRQYGNAIAAAKRHDPTAYCRELKADKFFTDDLVHYTSVFTSCLGMLRKMVASAPPAPNPVGDLDEYRRLTQLADDIAAGLEGLPPDPGPEAA